MIICMIFICRITCLVACYDEKRSADQSGHLYKVFLTESSLGSYENSLFICVL